MCGTYATSIFTPDRLHSNGRVFVRSSEVTHEIYDLIQRFPGCFGGWGGVGEC